MTELETKLIAALDDIGRLAMACRMDMQGRLADDEHKRAFMVLGSIAAQAASAIPEAAEQPDDDGDAAAEAYDRMWTDPPE